MAEHDDEVLMVQLTPAQAVVTVLGIIAVRSAIEALRVGGYPEKTPAELKELSRNCTEATAASAAMIGDLSAVPSELLAEAARALGIGVVRATFGRPPLEN